MAGIVGGRLFGVAKQARLLSSPVLSATGVGSNDVIVRALANIASRGTKDGTAVINMSLGGPVSTLLDSIISAKIADHGFIVVVAAGNDNDDACRYSPARNPNVITVRAIFLFWKFLNICVSICFVHPVDWKPWNNGQEIRFFEFWALR